MNQDEKGVDKPIDAVMGEDEVTTTPYERLQASERTFLFACGWEEKGEDEWLEPMIDEKVKRTMLLGPGGRLLTFGHAVNTELAYGKLRKTTPKKAIGDLIRAQCRYLLATGWEALEEGGWKEPEGRHGDRPYVYGQLKKAVNSQKQWDRIIRPHSIGACMTLRDLFARQVQVDGDDEKATAMLDLLETLKVAAPALERFWREYLRLLEVERAAKVFMRHAKCGATKAERARGLLQKAIADEEIELDEWDEEWW